MTGSLQQAAEDIDSQGMRAMAGARFLGLPIDALVLTPDGHEPLIRSLETQAKGREGADGP